MPSRLRTTRPFEPGSHSAADPSTLYRLNRLLPRHLVSRLGRPRTDEDDTVAEVINRGLQSWPTDGSTHYSARTLAAATGISKSTVHLWLQTFLLQSHRQSVPLRGSLTATSSPLTRSLWRRCGTSLACTSAASLRCRHSSPESCRAHLRGSTLAHYTSTYGQKT